MTHALRSKNAGGVLEIINLRGRILIIRGVIKDEYRISST